MNAQRQMWQQAQVCNRLCAALNIFAGLHWIKLSEQHVDPCAAGSAGLQLAAQLIV
jgi:hypothetical protein